MKNFTFDSDFELPRGEITRTRSNIAAIKLLKEIEDEERLADREEQEILAKYVGWGGLPKIFNPSAEGRWKILANQLKELLTDAEYDAAFESVLNAHYTSETVIKSIYDGLEHLGFTRGRILEPSLGTGNFFGHMPKEIEISSEVAGIELDSITGRIAKQLYPENEIHVQGFQDVAIPHDYYDVAIGNIPFGDYRITDSEYDHLDLRIHNYFFARTIDRVRPGGLVAFVTSTGTLQSKSGKSFRAWLSERANLVGAVRLPGDAFKEVAGTEVTTDIIILQKIGHDIPSIGHQWMDLADTEIQDSEGNYLQTNEYFVDNPEMMLGELSDDKLYPGRLALVSDSRDLGESLKAALSRMPSNIYRPIIRLDLSSEEELTRVKIPADTDIKEFGLLEYQDSIWQRRGNWLYPRNLGKVPTQRVLGMLQIRDAVTTVFDIQIAGGLDDELSKAQENLNTLYDKFIKKHGFLGNGANVRVFREDPDAELLLALETVDPDTKVVEKADVFFQRTVKPRIIQREAGTPQEALLASLNEYGRILPEYMASLLNVDSSEILSELSSQRLIFQDPNSLQWQTQDEYLSGDVRRKLEIARNYAKQSQEYQVNVEALSDVQPRDLQPGEIYVQLGSPWIPKEVIQSFAYELLEVSPEDYKINVDHNNHFAIWSVSQPIGLGSNARNNSVFGTDHYSALALIEDSLNLKDATVRYRDSDGKYHVDQEKTLAARFKQQEVKDAFKNWIWQDFDRAEKLCHLYNQVYNGSVDRKFQNPNLVLPGSSPEIELMPNQKNTVWRILQSRSTLVGHVVGAGKTFTLVASAMEMRRLGISKKPMIVVPNHMLEQFKNEFLQLYPAAKLLAPNENETAKKNRKKLLARIATGDWDAVIVTHSAFTRIPVAKSEQVKFLNDQLKELNLLLQDREVKNGNGVVKQLARERQKLKARIAKITKANKDDGVTFQHLGIDALLVDEAHLWKNLMRFSKLRNIAGLSNTNSKRAMDAFLKCSILHRQNARIVFATGTFITNTISEVYTMQRFLQPERLAERKVASFDAWVGNFAEKVTAPEIDPTGRFKTKTRLSRFMNVQELMLLFREVADIKTAKMLNLPRPESEAVTIAAPASPLQLNYMERLIDRAERIANRNVDRDVDNMLWVTTDGRRASLDPRLLNTEFSDFPESKVNQTVANVFAVWEATTEQRTVQMIFCDLGTPKADEHLFSVYQHIKDKLISKGIPAEEIAFIHDAKNSKQKESLYVELRSSRKRILIGSTEKCGIGMNIQKNLGVLHQLDPPWRASDIEQRIGRILRQGNLNPKVLLLTYVTQGRDGQLGFDSYSWQMLARKHEMAQQIMEGDTSIRSMDDISSDSLSYEEVKAIATGNELIIEKADVDSKVSELSRYKQSFLTQRHTNQRKLKQLPEDIERYQGQITRHKLDIEYLSRHTQEKFSIKLGNQIIDKPKEAGVKILSIVRKAEATQKEGIQTIGEFSGFKMILNRTHWGASINLESPNKGWFRVDMRDTPLKVVNSLQKTLDELPQHLASAERNLKQAQDSLEVLQGTDESVFSYEDDLQELLKRQFEINKELGLYKDDDAIADDLSEEETQEKAESQTEETEELVDVDAIVSLDSDWDWDSEDAWDMDVVCEPSPEVLAFIAENFQQQRVEEQATQSPQVIEADVPTIDEKLLDQVRWWYAVASALERPYLDEIRATGQSVKNGNDISDETLEKLSADKQEYNRSIATFIRDAKSIVAIRGQHVNSAKVFSGKNYTISQTSSDLSITDQKRGLILQITDNTVKLAKAVSMDFKIFDQFAARLSNGRQFPKAG